MNQTQLDNKAYILAKEFLLSLNKKGVSSELINKYLNLTFNKYRSQTLAEIYKRLLETAQNANMKAGVIGGSIGGIDNLNQVLCSFEPKKIIHKYQGNWVEVLNDIETIVKPRGKVRRSPNSIWPQFCRTILSGAFFIHKFSTTDDFFNWVEFFDNDDRARPALPMLLSHEVEGFGFALSCDFLKELGYVNFAKPDVHLKDIFKALSLCSAKADDYNVFKAIIRVANNVSVTPYNVDKLFWLIGSGYFYDDKHIGKKGRIGNHKKEFIEYAKRQLNM